MKGRSLFVWFRVARADEAAAVAAAQALQAAMRAALPGLACELLRRDDESPEACTLMEIYRSQDGVTPAGQALIEREAALHLGPWLQGPRHTEVFACV